MKTNNYFIFLCLIFLCSLGGCAKKTKVRTHQDVFYILVEQTGKDYTYDDFKDYDIDNQTY